MDSKNIHIVAARYRGKVTWTSRGAAPESEYVYLGLGPDFDAPLFTKTVTDLFGEGEVYFVSTRHDSRAMSVHSLRDEVERRISAGTITLWDKAFRRVMEIQPMGVFRWGIRR